MNTQLIGMLAETFVHVGAGQSEGVVDLPVAREAVTDFPFIPGSGLKGALLDWVRQHGVSEETVEALFGKPDNAGQLLFSDARLLALPVRSLHGASRWITCPQLWERYQRDAKRLGKTVPVLKQSPENSHALGEGGEHVILEERLFVLDGQVPVTLIETMSELLSHETTRQRFKTSIMVLSNDDFAWFARYGLAVQARNVLDEQTKTSNNLWYEENLPPDSLFYSLVSERQPQKLSGFVAELEKTPYLQVGGNETVGQGWLALAFPEVRS